MVSSSRLVSGALPSRLVTAALMEVSGFRVAGVFERARLLDGDGDEVDDGAHHLRGGRRADDRHAAHGPPAETHRRQGDAAEGIHRNIVDLGFRQQFVIAHHQAFGPRTDELVGGAVVEGRRGASEHLRHAVDKLANGLARAAGEHGGLHQGVQAFDFHPPGLGFGRAPAGMRGKLAGSDGGDQKSGQRHPVLRVLDS